MHRTGIAFLAGLTAGLEIGMAWLTRDGWPWEFALTAPAIACALLVLAWRPSRVPTLLAVCPGFAAGIALWLQVTPPNHDADLFPAWDGILGFFCVSGAIGGFILRSIAGFVKESEASVTKP